MNNPIETNLAPKAVGNYPHARQVGDLLFLSGIGPRSAADNSIPGNVYGIDNKLESYDISAQCHSVFTNVQAVLNKHVDVATSNTEEMEKLEMTKPELLQQLRVIWKSPLIPSDPLVWRKDLDPAIKAKLKDFILSYGKADAAEKAVLKNIYNYTGFRDSSNAQLIPIRQLENFKDRVKVESDATISADDKQKKLAEIDAKLLELERQARR